MEGRQTDTDRQVFARQHVLPFKRMGPDDRVQPADNALGDAPVRAREQHNKFFAAKTAQNIRISNVFLQKLADGHQYGIAGQMAETVVVFLEMIQVQHGDAQRFARFARDEHLLFQQLHEVRSGIQPGLAIMDGGIAQAFLRRPQFVENRQHQGLGLANHFYRIAVEDQRDHYA